MFNAIRGCWGRKCPVPMVRVCLAETYVSSGLVCGKGEICYVIILSPPTFKKGVVWVFDFSLILELFTNLLKYWINVLYQIAKGIIKTALKLSHKSSEKVKSYSYLNFIAHVVFKCLKHIFSK